MKVRSVIFRLRTPRRRSTFSAGLAVSPSAPPAPWPPRHRGPIRQLKTLLALSVVGGFFAVAALPAYAAMENEPIVATAAPASTADGQSIDASNVTTAAPVARDGFTVTSAAEIAAALRAQQFTARVAQYNASGARKKGDDYPWVGQPSRDEGGTISPLGYYYRECVDFVAWRLNRDAGSTKAPFKFVWQNLTPAGGDASQWTAAWQAKGWPISNVPIQGSVAVIGANHVAYVKQVIDGGRVLIEDYNWTPHAYSQRVVAISSIKHFLYPPMG